MLLTIHDMNLRQVASIDNDKQDALNYTNDKWSRYLETGSSTFEFTVFKRSLKKDAGSKHAYHYLNNKAFVSFEYEGEVQLFKVRKIVENEKTITCSCVNLNLELINEYANPFKSEQPKTFKEYCEAMDLLNFTLLTIGVNEISDKRIKAEWTGQDTKLARLLSLANKFGAELEFKTYLNDDSSIKSFVVNIYHENDDTHHGVGRIHAKPLRYGKDFKSLIRTVDNTNIYNAVRPTGKAENGDIVTIGGMEAWSVNNEYGEREFYQQGELLYAPLSMQMFPSAFTSGTTADQWIRKDITVDSADKKVIRATAYRELKKHAYPDVSYEVEGFIDRGIGDTVFVYDDGFVPTLLLRMRVVEQEISSTNPSSNRTRFANFKTLDNLLPDDLQKRIDELFEASQPYLIKLATDNGVIFKNGTGQSIVTPTLYKGGKPLTANVTWRWSLDGAVKTGMTYTVRGADVTDTSTLTVAAYIGNDEVAVDELTFVNVLDGRDGVKGEKGDPGQKGSDGLPGRDGVGIRSTTVAYASSTNGATAPTTGWTAAVPTVAPGNYLWTKTVWAYTDGNTETGYTVSRIGRDGNTGRDGIAGKDGVGIRSTTITYGKSTSGTIQPTSWTSQVPSVPNGQFLWTKTVWAYTDNTSETGYSVAKMGEIGPKGAQGIPGLSYHLFTTNYQYNQTSISQYSTPGYTGTWVVNEDTGLVKIGDTVSMSVYHTKKLGLVYILATVKAIASDRSLTTVSKGLIDKGEQGIPGEKGADGRTQYTHIAYADNATGGGFSQTDHTKAYIGMYQDFTAINSTNPTSYRWSKWKGSDGAQGIPGPKGADGRTPYIHWAYSDSADGTGLTTSDNGQRYIGHYSDYTQADSTDKTKYRWADRWAKIEVGGINLLTGTDEETVYISKDPAAMEFLRTPYDLAKVFDKHGLVTYTLSFDLKADKDGAVHVYMQNGSGSRYGGLHADIGVTTEWKRYHVTFTPTEGNMELSESFLAFYGVYGTGVVPYARKFKLEKGTVPTDWSLAIEDWQLELNSKAGQAFTQEQLNALNERAGIMQAELEAKASLDTVNNILKQIKDMKAADEATWAKVEKDLITHLQRVIKIETNLGDQAQRWNAVDTFMQVSNDGLSLGKADGSSSMLFSPDGRITMFSSGTPVMYVDKGVIHIDNGIFSKTVQIGRFREEQYHNNPDINVKRYVY
ncbi:phage tail spike protein [Streptococcus suis]|nr:phage tail spike protein [Streptococcus suis]